MQRNRSAHQEGQGGSQVITNIWRMSIRPAAIRTVENRGCAIESFGNSDCWTRRLEQAGRNNGSGFEPDI
jgi:hypothetical protein